MSKEISDLIFSRVIKFALWVITLSIVAHTYEIFQGGIESSIAVNQVEDSVVTYGFAQVGAMGGIETIIYFIFGIIILLSIWKSYKQISNLIKLEKKKN